MKIANYREEKAAMNVHKVDVKKVYDSKNALMNHITLQAGESLIPHITPVDAVFYILEGNPTVMIDNKDYLAKQDDVIESPKNIIHCLSNKSDKPARILVTKLPKPTTKTIFPSITDK